MLCNRLSPSKKAVTANCTESYQQSSQCSGIRTCAQGRALPASHMKRSREPEELPPTLSSLLSSLPPPSLALPASPASFGETVSRSSSVDRADTSGTEQPRAKIASLSHDPEYAVEDGSETATMTCLLHREHRDFPTYESYEMHYNKEHLNRCIECRRNFPSPMYLSLHGDEWHDPFVAVKREKGEHTVSIFFKNPRKPKKKDLY